MGFGAEPPTSIEVDGESVPLRSASQPLFGALGTAPSRRAADAARGLSGALNAARSAGAGAARGEIPEGIAKVLAQRPRREGALLKALRKGIGAISGHNPAVRINAQSADLAFQLGRAVTEDIVERRAKGEARSAVEAGFSGGLRSAQPIDDSSQN